MKDYQEFNAGKVTVGQISYVSTLSLWPPKEIYGQKCNSKMFIVRIQLV